MDYPLGSVSPVQQFPSSYPFTNPPTPPQLTPEQLQKLADYLSQPAVAVIPTKETHIGIALDASGSMSGIKAEIIGAYNSTIDQLVKDEAKLGAVYVTLVTFGEGPGVVIEKYRHQPLTRLTKLTEESYQPSGMTPFYDGLGTLLSLLKPLDIGGVDVAFLVNVFTDGVENHSREWVQPGMLKAEVERLQAKGNWTVTYAGANVNLASVAQATGLKLNNMVGFQSTQQGMNALSGQHVNSMASYSMSRGMGATASADFYGGGTIVPKPEEAPPVGQGVKEVMELLLDQSKKMKTARVDEANKRWMKMKNANKPD